MDLHDQLQRSLTGTHTLERELGGGGMSRVFVALELRLQRKVVVKVLSPELTAGISAERFEREIQLAASLQQANIVPVLTAGDTNGLPYFTMPYVEGESLRARLGKDGPLSITDVISILRDVARALAYAHARGVVHRDIKPDNVLLSGGTAVVTDFGIAKALSASRTDSGNATLTQLGAICVDLGVGLAFDRAGMTDSAIASYEHFVNTPSAGRLAQGALNLPGILQRLGELYEAKGDAAKAALYYGKFVDLWKHADPELQPRGADVRRRMAHVTDAPKSVTLPGKS